jgi:hypothetical protein
MGRCSALLPPGMENAPADFSRVRAEVISGSFQRLKDQKISESFLYLTMEVYRVFVTLKLSQGFSLSLKVLGYDRVVCRQDDDIRRDTAMSNHVLCDPVRLADLTA